MNAPESFALSPDTRDKLSRVGSANIANALLKRGFRNAYMLGIAPLSPDQEQLVGPAYTLRFIPSREDIDTMANYSRTDNLHRRAIEECPSGHVLVIDADCEQILCDDTSRIQDALGNVSNNFPQVVCQ